MKPFFTKFTFLFVFILGINNATPFAQMLNRANVNGYDAMMNKDIAEWHKNNIATKNEEQLVLLQFAQLPNENEKQLLSKQQVKLLHWLGYNTYIASIFPKADFSIFANITGIAAFLPQYKIHLSVAAMASKQKNVEALVSFFSNTPSSEVNRIFSNVGANVLPCNWQQKGVYKIAIPSAQLTTLASFTAIQFVGRVPENVLLDLDSKGAQNTSIVNMPLGLGGNGLDGTGVVMGHGDNCSGIYHIDQTDRTVNYNNGDITSHGVLVHGIMAGDGIMDLAGQGMAPNGTTISLFFDAVILLKEELFKGFNVTLTNNSYAAVVGDCSYSGTYDIISQNLDSMAFETKEQLDVFAAGNDGRLTCGGYPYGYYNICGGFQTAKNVLTVGATNRNLVLGDGSSRGPIKDGRLKPEITAVGIDILCPVPDNSYTVTRGTSLACPQVTGGLALLTQRYKQLFAGKNPKSDLLKALAINGATDLGRPGPDFWYGFGLLNIARSLEMLDSNRIMTNTISSGSAAQNYSVLVPANTAQLKVTMYYHDPMASASASKQLVNDLDLIVTQVASGNTFQPLILDPLATGVSADAVQGIDRLNNVEQVTINNPTAGNYTVTVKDFSIPIGPQEYVIVYDFVPNKFQLMFPIANATVAANSDMYIYWDAPYDATNTTKIEFSSDNGASWTTIANAVAANEKQFQWPVPNTNSNQCFIKLTRGSLSVISGRFVINTKPVLSLAPNQCPGSFAINWTAVPSADKYYLLLKKGAHFQKIDSVNASVLSYTYNGLFPSETYFVAVQPSIAGAEAYRSNAIFRKPNTGTCLSAIDGDIAFEQITSPNSGRRATSTELKIKTPISVQIRNQDNDAVANYSISYKVNSSVWKTITGFTIAANTATSPIVDSFDFSDTINYTITMAVQNLDKPDPVTSNDTLIKVIKHIPNNIISLTTPINNDFESLPDLTMRSDTIGFSNDGYWDFSTSNIDTGRMRTRIPGSKLVITNRSVSMDVNVNNKKTVNFVTATFNLSNYDTSIDEVRFDFDYEMRGMPKLRDSNKVWVRGSDLLNWIPVFIYSNVFDTAKLHNSGTISLREIFAKNKHAFSTSTQIRFGQYDTTLIVDDNYGGGLTIDNVHLYKVLKDVQLTRVVSPSYSNCEINSSSVSLMVKNGTVNTAKDITIAYTIDGNTPVIEVIPDSLLGNDSLLYVFTLPINSLSLGKHSIKAWIHTVGDDFLANDTISNFVFYNTNYENQFPLLQNFESNNGNWYVNGRNPSWEWGVPNGNIIKTAASGKKVWKTNLNGNYNANEFSYLVSPCLNTIGLSKPMISFSTAFDLEQCVAVCDRVYLEYSWDNEQTWIRLGNNGQGTNWYNNDIHNVWNGNETRWHVASFELPRAEQLKLRFVMASDMGANYDGIAIDDIHIFDKKAPIANVSINIESKSTPENITGNNWASNLYDNQILANVQPNGQSLANFQVQAFAQSQKTDKVSRQYVFPRSYLISKYPSIGAVGLRLFVTDAEAKQYLDDTSCTKCTKAIDIYRTGITRFTDNVANAEDNLLDNNNSKLSAFLSFDSLNWVPYDNGYYAELLTKDFGEFWFNSGGILGTLATNTEYVTLDAQKFDNTRALITWQSPIDTQMKIFTLLRATDSVNFVVVDSIKSLQKLNSNYQYYDTPTVAIGTNVFYKLLCKAQNDSTFYSNIASVAWTQGSQLLALYPIPSSDGLLRVKWTGPVNSTINFYLTDMQGKLVFAGSESGLQWQNESVINLNFLAKGIYFFNLQIGDNTYTEKIIFK